MKILLYTDVHWTKNSSIINTRGSKYSSRLENLINSVNWAERTAVEQGCDEIVCLGDFFDKTVLNAEELTALKEVEWADLPHTFLIGNHETEMRDLQYASCHALPEDFEIIDKLTLKKTLGVDMYFLPYMQDVGIKDLITRGENQTIIFSHNDIAGIQYGPTISKCGFDIKEIEDCCDLFINGHLHNGDNITDKVINLGNLTGVDFKEDAFKYRHNVAILDTNTLKLTLIENPFAFNFYRIEYKDVPLLNKEGSVFSKGIPVLIVNVTESESKVLDKELLNGTIHRVNIKYEMTVGEEDQVCFEMGDHLGKFRDCVYGKMGISNIVTEELNYVCGLEMK